MSNLGGVRAFLPGWISKLALALALTAIRERLKNGNGIADLELRGQFRHIEVDL